MVEEEREIEIVVWVMLMFAVRCCFVSLAPPQKERQTGCFNAGHTEELTLL
jgi:hypothetical protein